MPPLRHWPAHPTVDHFFDEQNDARRLGGGLDSGGGPTSRALFGPAKIPRRRAAARVITSPTVHPPEEK
jgi:hypothetical protein